MITVVGLTSKRFISKLPIHELVAASRPLDNVTVSGWVQRTQKRGPYAFLHIYDGLSSNSIQVVLPKASCTGVSSGVGVTVSGSWQKSVGSQQNMELQANSCIVHSVDSEPRYDNLTPDQMRLNIHLRSRFPSFSALLRLRSALTIATHDFFMNRNFVHIDVPMVTSNDCEGAGETFSIKAGSDEDNDFFGSKRVFFTVSGQLHLEAMTCGISNVYTLGPGLRAEKQQSSSHLSEFRMLEAEVAFCEDLDEICQLMEDYVRNMAQYLLKTQSSNLKELGKYSDPNHFTLVEAIASSSSFPRVDYSNCCRILKDAGEKIGPNGFSKKNEAYLVKHFNSPLFVTHFPSSQKPFYMKRSADDQLTESFDLLCPIVGELAGGSVRENSVERLAERGSPISWYTDCRQKGKPPSAGFGLGFERLLQVLLGIRNIKDAIPFPRWYKHCQC